MDNNIEKTIVDDSVFDNVPPVDYETLRVMGLKLLDENKDLRKIKKEQSIQINQLKNKLQIARNEYQNIINEHSKVNIPGGTKLGEVGEFLFSYREKEMKEYDNKISVIDK